MKRCTLSKARQGYEEPEGSKYWILLGVCGAAWRDEVGLVALDFCRDAVVGCQFSRFKTRVELFRGPGLVKRRGHAGLTSAVRTPRPVFHQ